jgi:protein TonB
VVLFLVVDAQGQPRDIRLQRSLGMGLDEKAMAAVSKWRFQPATLDGKPVATQINVEVTFRLF